MTPPTAHGTLRDPNCAHPVLDIELWKRKFPLTDECKWDTHHYLYRAEHLAYFDQLINLPNEERDPEEQHAETDVFVWKSGSLNARNPLTKLGGKPWMPTNEPWPTDPQGHPLQFIGQINFTDSKDLIPFDLPGDVLLLFARWTENWVSWDLASIDLKWVSRDAVDPESRRDYPPGSTLPFCHEGVIHRTKQFWIPHENTPNFRISTDAVQATLIGTHARIPQGWPLEEDGCTLICVFSSFSFRGDWPLCDLESLPQRHLSDGRLMRYDFDSAFGVLFADAGAIWVYRDQDGDIKHEMSC